MTVFRDRLQVGVNRLRALSLPMVEPIGKSRRHVVSIIGWNILSAMTPSIILMLPSGPMERPKPVATIRPMAHWNSSHFHPMVRPPVKPSMGLSLEIKAYTVDNVQSSLTIVDWPGLLTCRGLQGIPSISPEKMISRHLPVMTG